MTLPTNTSFAEEVKSDRLKILNWVVMSLSVTILLGIITFGTLSDANSSASLISSLAVILMMIGAVFSNFMLKRNRYNVAAWFFILSPTVAMSLVLYQLDGTSLEVIPFVFPIIVFIGGLLVSPLSTLWMTLLSVLIIIFVPSMRESGFVLSVSFHQFYAVVLTSLSAGLAALVTGELYQITQWALDNYNRERRTNVELFEKRQELQKSLKRAEILGEKLQESYGELELAHAEAKEAKHFRGQFLANMSHELRTPLNAIIGFSETMLQFPIMYDDQELPEAYERDLHQIYNSGRQLLHVINDILDLAKVDAGKLEIHMQKVEIGAVVNAVLSTAKGLLGNKPVKLIKEIPEELPFVWADETRLRQVLLNLYSNACKYTDEGMITLNITETDANELKFTVSDTGTGIDPEFHEELFKEFKQAKHSGRDPRSGSGLGLAISKQLLELMDGRIWLESTPGDGSSFYFVIKKYRGQLNEETSPERPKTMTIKTAAPIMETATSEGTE